MSTRTTSPTAVKSLTIEEQAHRWFALMQSDQCSEADVNEYKAWLNADLAHRRAYREIEQLWGMLGGFGERAEIQALRANALQGNAVGQAPSRWRRWLPITAVASLLVAFLVVTFTGHRAAERLMAGGVYETRVGEQRTLALADGSTLVLDTQTRITLDLGEQQRMIELHSGQARFDVAHDEARPFVVRAGKGAITALGTAFVVRKADDEILVTLLEGKVAVAPAVEVETYEYQAPVVEPVTPPVFEELLLEAGQQVVYTDEEIMPAETVNLEQVTAWQQGRLVFEDHTLAEVLDDLNRYSQSKILLGDESMGGIRITGVFKTGDSARVVETLKAYFSMRVTSDKQGNVILMPAG